MRPNYRTRIDNVVSIGFKNFSGDERRKTFSAFLYPEDAERLSSEGWKVKEYVNRYDEGSDPQPYIDIVANFSLDRDTGEITPKIYRCLGRNRLPLDAKMCNVLDDDVIENAHLIINPYWSKGKNRMTDAPTAYLHIGYFDVNEEAGPRGEFKDPFAENYED